MSRDFVVSVGHNCALRQSRLTRKVHPHAQGVALAPTPGQTEYVAGFWADVRQALSKYPLTAATRTALLQLACAGNGFPQA